MLLIQVFVLLCTQMPNFWIVATLLPIVGGVVLASFTEASFNWYNLGSFSIHVKQLRLCIFWFMESSLKIKHSSICTDETGLVSALQWLPM